MLGCLALASCGSLREPTTAQLLRRAVDGMPGVAAGAALVSVEADSTEAAWGRIVRARTETPLAESRLLARAFEAAAAEPALIAVGGPYPKLTEQVLLDAFALARTDPLAGLRLVHVSPEPPSAELLAVCAKRGAVCEHRAWTGRPAE